MTSLIQAFAAWLYQVGYREGTQTMLPACVREFLHQQQITDVRYIEQQPVKDFYAWLQIRPLKRGSGGLSEMMISHYVYALRTFFSWLEVTGQIHYNPISGMRFRRPSSNSRQPLSREETGRLFAAAAASWKETALLHLFYSCGLRRSEGEALNIGDVRCKERRLYVRSGKGARRRVVPMTQRVARDLEAYYLQERCHYSVRRVKDEEAFILNRAGRRMSGEGYNDLLKRLTGKAGIGPEVSLHHLRHSIATHLLQSGLRLEQVRDFLGHRYLETTQGYARPSAAQLKLL